MSRVEPRSTAGKQKRPDKHVKDESAIHLSARVMLRRSIQFAPQTTSGTSATWTRWYPPGNFRGHPIRHPYPIPIRLAQVGRAAGNFKKWVSPSHILTLDVVCYRNPSHYVWGCVCEGDTHFSRYQRVEGHRGGLPRGTTSGTTAFASAPSERRRP